jgi:hypothetical protein
MEQKKKKFRQLSDLETGKSIVPAYEEYDEEILNNLWINWPIRAELAVRDAHGKNIIPPMYSGNETNVKKRKDTFKPEYEEYDNQCPCPVRDQYGEYTQRCSFKITEQVLDSHKEEYEKVRNKNKKNKKDFSGVSLEQYVWRKHFQSSEGKSHFDWWVKTKGLKMQDNQGNMRNIPPETTVVEFPEWELEEV